MVKIVFILILVILFASPAWSKMYKWVDENGKTHFTDSLNKIPKKYRKQLKTLKSVGKAKIPSSPPRGPALKNDSVALKTPRVKLSPKDTLSKMISAAEAGDWESYVDDYYGEQHKFRSSADRDKLVSRFREKWGSKVIPGLREASRVEPHLSTDGNKAIFKMKQGDFILYKSKDGYWMFHL